MKIKMLTLHLSTTTVLAYAYVILWLYPLGITSGAI